HRITDCDYIIRSSGQEICGAVVANAKFSRSSMHEQNNSQSNGPEEIHPAALSPNENRTSNRNYAVKVSRNQQPHMPMQIEEFERKLACNHPEAMHALMPFLNSVQADAGYNVLVLGKALDTRGHALLVFSDDPALGEHVAEGFRQGYSLI